MLGGGRDWRIKTSPNFLFIKTKTLIDASWTTFSAPNTMRQDRHPPPPLALFTLLSRRSLFPSLFARLPREESQSVVTCQQAAANSAHRSPLSRAAPRGAIANAKSIFPIVPDREFKILHDFIIIRGDNTDKWVQYKCIRAETRDDNTTTRCSQSVPKKITLRNYTRRRRRKKIAASRSTETAHAAAAAGTRGSTTSNK